MGKMKNTYEILTGKPERKRPRGRSNCRQENNIKMNLKINSMWAES